MSVWLFALFVVGIFTVAFGCATWLDRKERDDTFLSPYHDIDLPEIKGEGSSMRVLPPEQQEDE